MCRESFLYGIYLTLCRLFVFGWIIACGVQNIGQDAIGYADSAVGPSLRRVACAYYRSALCPRPHFFVYDAGAKKGDATLSA